MNQSQPPTVEPQPPHVEPLDEDGVGAALTGTVLWAGALLVLIVLRERLTAADAQWWIAVAATGVALGLVGLLYTTRRRSAYRRARAQRSEGSAA